MKLYPTKTLKFKLIDSQESTISRLTRRTDKSKSLTSLPTQKSFRGLIHHNDFKLISSAIGRGAFCVMTGTIEANTGHVQVEIHKVFRILLSIMMLMPVFGILAMIINNPQELSFTLIPVIIGFMLMIRFIFIELIFQLFSKESLNRLRDVLDIEWMKH